MKKSYRFRFQSFWYVTSNDEGIGPNVDDECCHRHRHCTNAVDAFDVTDAAMLMKRPDAANLIRIFVSSATNYLFPYFLMTLQNLEHVPVNHNNMDRLLCCLIKKSNENK